MEQSLPVCELVNRRPQTIIHRDLQFYNDAGLSPDFIFNTLGSLSDEM